MEIWIQNPKNSLSNRREERDLTWERRRYPRERRGEISFGWREWKIEDGEKGRGDKNYEGFIVHNHVKGYVEASSNYVDRILSCWICRFSTDSINYELVEIFHREEERGQVSCGHRRRRRSGRASFLSGKAKPEKGLEGTHARKGEGGRERMENPQMERTSTRPPPPPPPLPQLDGYFPLLKEKRERERGERRMCRMQFHRDDVCEDACCFPRGCALSLLLPFHKETIFVAGARG